MENYEQIWNFIHPHIREVAQSRFESGHYADAAEAAIKEINKLVKDEFEKISGNELDGFKLMMAAFSRNPPSIVLTNLPGESGDNVQEGFMHIFAGAIRAIRNPKAHQNLNLPPLKAIHFIFLASLLMIKFDEAMSFKAQSQP